jgi:hypothetical protein
MLVLDQVRGVASMVASTNRKLMRYDEMERDLDLLSSLEYPRARNNGLGNRHSQLQKGADGIGCVRLDEVKSSSNYASEGNFEGIESNVSRRLDGNVARDI